jgi:hypothetical protein
MKENHMRAVTMALIEGVADIVVWLLDTVVIIRTLLDASRVK